MDEFMIGLLVSSGLVTFIVGLAIFHWVRAVKADANTEVANNIKKKEAENEAATNEIVDTPPTKSGTIDRLRKGDF